VIAKRSQLHTKRKLSELLFFLWYTGLKPVKNFVQKKNRVREAKKWEWSGGKPKCTTNIKAADCDVNHLLRFPRARERTFNLKKPYSCYMSARYK